MTHDANGGRPDASGPADVRTLARLAGLELTESEIARFGEDLDRLLAWAASLSDKAALPSGESPTDVTPSEPRSLRPDLAAPSLARDVVLAEAPRIVDGAFAVATFVDEG